MKPYALILANGDPPKKHLLRSLVSKAALIVCADGGANTALKFGVKPGAIVGDMDSIHAEALVRFRKIQMVEDRDENSTDLEKAIQWTVKQKYERIVVTGVTGRRLDHTIGNLGVLPKFHSDASITFVDDQGELSYVGREIQIDSPRGTVVSLIPITRCEGVETVGLEYALNNESLELGVREGTSNVVVSSPASVKVKKGKLLLYTVTPTRQ
ncbi:MAG TPA: thiamine diphosphokinase [Bacteroidota bacterium]|nr:thiamine diphosphokinase [Bacteroidota bacterium]